MCASGVLGVCVCGLTVAGAACLCAVLYVSGMCDICMVHEGCGVPFFPCSLLGKQERPSNSQQGALLLPKAVFYPLSPREEGSSRRTRRNGPGIPAKWGMVSRRW